MSDCESEDYSCSEDEDYVPSGGEYSEDDINDLVKESGDDEDEEGSKKPSDVKSKKKSSKNYPARCSPSNKSLNLKSPCPAQDFADSQIKKFTLNCLPSSVLFAYPIPLAGKIQPILSMQCKQSRRGKACRVSSSLSTSCLGRIQVGVGNPFRGDKKEQRRECYSSDVSGL
uniref:Craniofacial development protein 1 n=1 Tax=Xenopus tropicalis TaxID=8364 RepID=A0A803K019_XENTR